MGYWTGAVDGLFDPATGLALIAFQNWAPAENVAVPEPEELKADILYR